MHAATFRGSSTGRTANPAAWHAGTRIAQPCQQGSSACFESICPVKIWGAVLFAAGRRSGAMKSSRHSAMRSMPAAFGCRPSGSRPCSVLDAVRQGNTAEIRAVGSGMPTCQHRRMLGCHPSPGQAKAQPAQPQRWLSIRQSSPFVLAKIL